MNMFKPYATLFVGVVLGIYVVPKALRAVNINLPGV